jgi:cytochrome c oxidase subunit 2
MRSRALSLALALLLAGCAGRQSALDPGGDQAQQLHGLFNLMLVVCGVVYILVLGFLASALWRARRSLGAGVEPAPDTEPNDAGLKKGLGVWVAAIAVGLVTLAGASFLVDRALARQAGSEAPSVRITGQQWWWRIEVRDPASGRWIETANELHLPINQPTRIQILSADVIHSFWVPNLSGKIDMIPGRTNDITITPRKLGWVRGQCAEFCGLQHAQMALDVKVDSAADYAAWLAAQGRDAAPPADATLSRGRDLIASGPCAQCHAIRGTAAAARAGPDLTHVGGRRSLAAGTLPMSRGDIMGWIAQPQALKPGAEMPATGLAPADADAVARYLESLR